VRLEGLSELKKTNSHQESNLPACSIVPQPYLCECFVGYFRTRSASEPCKAENRIPI
jgi:hypothetical protein